MNRLFLTALAVITLVSANAQDSTSVTRPSQGPRNKKAEKRERINNLMRMEEEGDLIFNKHNIFGIRLATDGYGINFEKGRYKTTTRTMIYQFEFNEKKSPKEHRVSTTADGYNFTSVVPYKLNNFYSLKLALGEQRLLGGKGNKNGVSVTYLYTGGLSLALLKPYYIDVAGQNGANPHRTTFDQLAKDTVLYGVTGAAGPFVGWGHLSVKPGLNAKAAMRFDYGRLNQTVSAIEAGVTGEFYFSKIPMLLLVPQKQFFFNAYVQIMFGSRK